MPLTRAVSFRAGLQKSGRITVPKRIRWEFKLETTQTLKVTVSLANEIGAKESFFGNMNKQGYIAIPPITTSLLRVDKTAAAATIIDIRLEPA